MKRLFTLILALALCLSFAVSVSAAQMPLLVDAADLLSDWEEAQTLHLLEQVREELQVELVIVTMDSLGGHSADAVIEAFYDEYAYGYGPDRDGVCLLVSMAEREYRILCNNYCARAITPDERDGIGNDVASFLSGGDYYGAFDEFIDGCVYQIKGERNGFPFNFGMSLLVSLAIGFVVALIATGIMRAKLRSVRTQSAAREYIKPGSMQLTRSTDLFLYRTMDRRRKPQNTSTGTRSGGGGGRHVGGGKF